jgi:hydrogenase maturation factor
MEIRGSVIVGLRLADVVQFDWTRCRLPGLDRTVVFGRYVLVHDGTSVRLKDERRRSRISEAQCGDPINYV